MTSAKASASSSDRYRGRRGPSIAVKLGGLLAVLVVLLLTVTAVLYGQLRSTVDRYDALIRAESRQGLDSRRMQVELKVQVQEFKNVLLRGADPADLREFTTRFRDQNRKVEELNSRLLAEVDDLDTRLELEEFRREYRALNADYEAGIAGFVASGARDPGPADEATRGADRVVAGRVDTIVGHIESAIADAVAAQKSDVATQQRILVAVGLVVLVAVLAVVVLVVLDIVRPVRRLTLDAYRAANETLPAAVARIRSLPVDADEPPPMPTPLRVRTGDELEELGRALSTMQARAVELAWEQHRAERDSAEVLINLGRRNQNLLGRTLSYITELERAESDPDVLAELFRLDHATTRIRRGAESMLVLAGAAQTRTWSRPVPVGDVVRSALAEVEHHQRVDVHHLDDAAVVGSAVADVVHLIAELVENATLFSPPNTHVTVLGQRLLGAYRLRIVDNGIGMTDGELEQANDRIKRATGRRTDTQLLGLHVVGKLAARRSIEVSLDPSPGRGITATVELPPSVLAPAAREPASVGSGDGAGAALVRTAEPRSRPAAPRAPSPSSRPGPARSSDAADPPPAPPDVSRIRERLGALQRGVRAARRDSGTASPVVRPADTEGARPVERPQP